MTGANAAQLTALDRYCGSQLAATPQWFGLATGMSAPSDRSVGGSAINGGDAGFFSVPEDGQIHSINVRDSSSTRTEAFKVALYDFMWGCAGIRPFTNTPADSITGFVGLPNRFGAAQDGTGVEAFFYVRTAPTGTGAFATLYGTNKNGASFSATPELFPVANQLHTANNLIPFARTDIASVSALEWNVSATSDGVVWLLLARRICTFDAPPFGESACYDYIDLGCPKISSSSALAFVPLSATAVTFTAPAIDLTVVHG